MDSHLTRRAFLGGCGALVLAACGSGGSGDLSCGAPALDGATAYPPELGDPFRLGVASGDPLPRAIVLWTRLAPDPLSPQAMPLSAVRVAWEMARDESFRDVVRSGVVATLSEVAHSVHVDVRDLEPGTTYWYRFVAGPYASPTGRTRTAPAKDASLDRLTFAVASCQAWQSGYYTAYRHLAADDPAFVLFLGDYIYELEASRAARPHDLRPAATLDEFRTFYALNRSDPDLQAAHAAAPWIVIWDDHEVEDNYAGLEPGGIGVALDPDARAKFPARRAAAYQAWWEHMPIRACAPIDGDLRIYRDFAFADLLHLAVLDDRQYRSPIAVGEGTGNLPRLFGGGPQLAEAFDESRTMLGREQEAWLRDTFERARRARWTVLGQQTVMAEVDRAPDDPAKGFSMDAWDGYVAARNRLLCDVQQVGLRNLICVGGDIHTSCVTDLLADYHAAGSPRVGTELVAPSVSAIELLPASFAEATLQNPHIHLYDTVHRGYLRCEVSRDACRADYRWVATTASPSSELEPAPAWVIEDGAPGARRV